MAQGSQPYHPRRPKSATWRPRTDYAEAVAYLDGHIGQGVKPGLERIETLLDMMAAPHRGYPVVHVAGTNGKTSTVHIISSIISAHGLVVGSFISPHLDRIETRFAINGESMTPEEFAKAMTDVEPFVDLYEERHQDGITYFELTAALAFAWFAARAVDVAVVEVGLGGRLDATNVIESRVAVVTGIATDHTEFLGDTIREIAAEKMAIAKPESVLVTGALPDDAFAAAAARVAEIGLPWKQYDADYRLDDAVQAVGGWLCDVDGIYDNYAEVLLPLHGRHQTRNLAVAVAAVEELFGGALDVETLRLGVNAVRSPGRLEVVRRRPLVVLDGAHNVQGIDSLAGSLFEEFLPTEWILVVGVRGSRDVAALLEPLRDQVGTVIATAPDDPAAIPPRAVAEGAVVALGADVDAVETETVPEALARALALAGEDGAVVVTGSLYVVGEARGVLLEDVPS